MDVMERLAATRPWFKAAYIVFLLVQIVPPVNHWRYADIFLLVFMLWGYALLAADVVKNRLRSFKNRAFVPLFAFFVLCGVGLVSHPHNALMNGLLRLGIFFLCGAVLYITDSRPDNLRREARSVAAVYAAMSALMAAVSIAMYLLQVQYQFTGPLGETFRMGVWENRLFGLFSSGNVGGSVMALGLFCSLYLLVSARTMGGRVLSVAAAVLQLWHIALTLSRGTMLSLLVATTALCALYPLRRQRWREVAARAACLLLTAAVLLGGVAVCRRGSLAAVSLLEESGLVHSEVTGFDRVEYDDDGPADISNKRFSIWKATWHLSKRHLLTGTGRHYYEYLRVKDTATWLTAEDHTYLTWSKGNTHNGYLQILADAGLPALVCYLAFLVWCLAVTWRAYARADAAGRRWLALTTGAVVYVLVNNVFESNMVLMSTNPIQAAFWLAAGWHMALCANILHRGEGAT